jgi:hypothetical protein
VDCADTLHPRAAQRRAPAGATTTPMQPPFRLATRHRHALGRGALTVALLVTVVTAACFSLRTRDRDTAAQTPAIPPTVNGGTAFRIERLPADPAAGTGPAATATPPPHTPQPYLDRHRVVSFYGNPLASGMGIVGEYPPEELIRRLRAQAAVYQALSPDRTVVPAIHFIYAVAQAQPGRDGLHLLRMDDELVRQWIQITKDHGLLLFLDIQFGRSSVERELPHVLPYLTEPHVHVAFDPEFAWAPHESPAEDIGSLDGAVINRAIDMLEQLIVEHRLANKILIVHQFRPDMITNKAAIRPSPWVETVIDADGFGARNVKIGQWNQVIRDDNVERAGFKLFYKQDAKSGGLMAETEVMALEPAPLIIIYQ